MKAVRTISLYQQSHIPYFTLQQRHIDFLQTQFPAASIRWCSASAEFVKVLPDTQVAVCWAFKQKWFDLAPQLRLLATPTAGRDFAPVIPPPSVKMLYGTHHGPIMAESVLGLILAVNRGLFIAHAAQLQGNIWPASEMFQLRLLQGSHAVIVGFGRIGQHIGAKLKAFGVRITGVRRDQSAPLPVWFAEQDTVITIREMDGVLGSADHLVLVLPSDTGTDQMFDAQRLSRLSPHTVIYNVGRGNCLDETALAQALLQRRLGGACLDVFAQEPLVESSPLAVNLPGLIRLPHATAFAHEYLDHFLLEVSQWLQTRGVGA